jgi:3-oxoacyl-[acyl-carrier protein] reductase
MASTRPAKGAHDPHARSDGSSSPPRLQLASSDDKRIPVNDPVFLVSGASSGIGQSLVNRLVAMDRRVVAADADNHRLEEAARLAAWPMAAVRLVPLDVREPAQWSAAFAAGTRAFGGIDVLLHTASHLKAGEAHAAAADDVHRHLDVNAKGTAFALQAAAAHMLPRGGGHAVVLSSLDAFAPRPGLGLHGAAAAAARAVALAADLELRPRGLAVTVVCTATVDAPADALGLGARAADQAGGPEVSADVVVEAVLGRALPGKPRELVVPPSQGLAARLAWLSPALGAYLWNRRERHGRGPGHVRTHPV